MLGPATRSKRCIWAVANRSRAQFIITIEAMSESNKNERVTAEEVRRVAELAYLKLTSDEEIRMQRDLNAILDYIAQLNELDTSQIEPMAQVAEVLGNSPLALRADEQRPSLPRRGIMAAAPDTDGTFFKVPKVIER